MKERTYKFVMWIIRRDRNKQDRMCAGYTSKRNPTHPLKTKKECRAAAKRDGVRAVFEEPVFPR